MLKINELSKNYGSKRALDRISLEFPRGEIVGIFGENGAGKSTLMKSVFGFIPHRGEITLDGEPITRKNIEKLSFATCEHSFFPDLTAAGHRDFYRDYFGGFSEKRMMGLMEFFGLPMHKTVGSMSTGQQNQFEVILALSQGADYIFMDEPFAGNDIFNREDFYRVLLGILEPHETLILSTHLIEEVSDVIGRAVLIHRGRVVGDITAAELDERGESLADHIKSVWGYRSDRVARALESISDGEGEDRREVQK